MMTDVGNRALHILRDLRKAIKSLDGGIDAVDGKVDHGSADLRSRMDGPPQAINGESVPGRYAASEVEERLEAPRLRISKLARAT